MPFKWRGQHTLLRVRRLILKAPKVNLSYDAYNQETAYLGKWARFANPKNSYQKDIVLMPREFWQGRLGNNPQLVSAFLEWISSTENSTVAFYTYTRFASRSSQALSNKFVGWFAGYGSPYKTKLLGKKQSLPFTTFDTKFYNETIMELGQKLSPFNHL